MIFDSWSGHADLGSVGAVVLETDGTLSFLAEAPAPGGPR